MGFISTNSLHFLTWPAFSASFLLLFSCHLLTCVLIWYDCSNIATDNSKISGAHNDKKVFLTLSLRLAAALPGLPIIPYCGSVPKICSLGLGWSNKRCLGRVTVARTQETKPNRARTSQTPVCATSTHIPLAKPGHVFRLQLGVVGLSIPLVEWDVGRVNTCWTTIYPTMIDRRF